MDKQFKFVLPSPNFDKKSQDACKTKSYYLTPSGMSLLPREKQPPPMYGVHGTTLPPRYIKQHFNPASSDEINPSEKQYCESCELELHSMDDLKRHRAQHEKCPVVGCQYKGHPTVMDSHINALHASGLFDKFKKLSTPEEIAAWRDERRKRYPTLANILLKQKAKEQRLKRGERLEPSKSRFGNVNNRKRVQANKPDVKNETNDEKQTHHKNNRKNRKNKNKKFKNQDDTINTSHYKYKPNIQNDQKVDEEDESSFLGITMFRGTSLLENYKHLNDKKNNTNNVLYGLVGMYGSDDDLESDEDNDNQDSVENIQISKNNEDLTENSFEESVTKIVEMDSESTIIYKNCLNEKISHITTKTCTKPRELPVNSNTNIEISALEKSVNTVICEPVENGTSMQNAENSSDEPPEEIPIQRSNPDYSVICENNEDQKTVNEPESKRVKLMDQTRVVKQKTVTRKSGLDYRKARLRKQNTMLEKLLETDIRHERNVLLQCVRFVCENKFFDIDENKNQTIINKNKIKLQE